ncbi:MAG: hypothetical protein ACJ79S_18885 [Gemmatimonadaceae bacterium]
MSALARLRATRTALTWTLAAAALLWALAAASLVVAVAALADWRAGLPRAARELATAVATAAAVAAGAAVLWRGRRVRSAAEVALWVEQRRPELRYALLTLADPAVAADTRALERSVATVSWRADVMRTAARALAAPLVLLALGAAVLLAVPRGALSRTLAPRPGDALRRPVSASPEAASRLAPLVARVVPPAYTGERPSVLDEPLSVAAVVGSRIELTGRGPAAAISAAIAGRTLRAAAGGDGEWRIALAMPPRAAALRLDDAGRFGRVLALEPRPDSVPVVTLVAPAQDTVLRAPEGAVPVAAEARDDFGIAELRIEIIVSSGEGESFTFRSGVLRGAAPGGARAASLRASLRLDSLGIKAGDVVHLRAVARDRNDVSGPGIGASETRTVRVARAGEYDSVSVDAAPPPAVDSSALSQRLLLQLAEALERRRPRLARAVVVAESRDIGRDQARLRRRVGDIVFERLGGEGGAEHAHGNEGDDRRDPSPAELLAEAEASTGRAMTEALDFEGDETPVVAVNRPLLEAYNAMWSAGRELDVGEPGRALPHMRAALRAIQRARDAERLYLRGRPPAVVVDVARVRLAGSDGGAAPRARTPRAPVDSAAAWRLARFDAALGMLPGAPGAAADSLLVLRLATLGAGDTGASGAASALGAAVERLRSGGSATDALVRARRAVAGAAEQRGGVPRWGSAW